MSGSAVAERGPATAARSRAEGERYHAMDALRGAMMLLGVVFHTSLPYVAIRRVDWFHDPSQSFFFDLVAISTHSFRMPVFFMAAGFFAALLYEKRGLADFGRNRFRRIVVPFLLGWLILAPLCNAAMKFGFRAVDGGSLGSGFEWLETGRWLHWRAIYHLWFLVALVVLYPAALGARWLVSRLGEGPRGAMTTVARRFLVSPWRPLLLLVPVAAMMIPMQFGEADALSFFSAAWLSMFFALGWVVHAQVDLLPAMERHAWIYAAVALAALPFVAWGHHVGAPGQQDVVLPRLILGAGVAVTCAFTVFGVLGLTLRYFSRPSPLARYVADSSYWVYLVHLPLVLFIAALLALLPLPAPVKWLMTLGIAVPILFLSYHYLVRFTPIGTLLNGRRYRGGQVPVAVST